MIATTSIESTLAVHLSWGLFVNTCPRCGATYMSEGKVCPSCRSRPLSRSEVVAVNAGPTDVGPPPGAFPETRKSTVFIAYEDDEVRARVTGESDSRTPMPKAADQDDEPPGLTVPLKGLKAAEEKEPPPGKRDMWIGRVLLGQFRIVKKLGEGGFGAAYLAEQQQLTGVSKAVVKLIREDLPEQHRDMVVKRFLREVVTLEKLDNHHLPKLLGSGRSDGQLFLIMQSAGDFTLTALLKRGRMPPERALDIAAQVCDALGEAHRWQVVHRDVKPDNILMTERPGEDRVKLIDVGIAKILGGSEIEDPNSKLSHARLVIGTPAYMSPEQVLGSASLDGRSDLYSLACVLYEMLTGRLPVVGRTNQELLRGHVSVAPVPLKQAGAPLPGYFQALLDRGLQKDAEKRFQSAAELRAALEVARARFLQDQKPRPSRRRIAIAAAGIAVVVAVLFAARTAFTPSTESLPIAAATLAAAPPRAPPDNFVQFAGGTLQMGRAAEPGEDAAPDTPVHSVKVGPFALAKTETRVTDYAGFVRRTGAPRPAGLPDADPRFADLPVINVPRDEAARYCAQSFPGGGRLPTEAEWEWAARGGGPRLYPYGDDFRSDCINAMQGEDGHLEAVESRPCGKSPEGLFGLSGNAWEWTATDAAAYPGSQFPVHAGLAVIRGGSFFQEKQIELTATYRWFVPPTANRTIGFRCAFGRTDGPK